MKEELLDDLFIPNNNDNDYYKKYKHLRFSIRLLVLTAIIATSLAWFDIESIIGSGPIGSLMGLIVIYMARRIEHRAGFLVGLSAPAIALVGLLLILAFEWSPREAHVPISSMLSIYTLCLMGTAFMGFGAKKEGPY